MLALAGACVTMAGALGAGFCICAERKQRVSQLKALEHAFDLIAGEIAYSRISLPEVLTEAGEKLKGPLGEAFSRAGRRMEDGAGQDIRTVWGEEMGAYLSGTRLKKQEKELALSFPETVWFLDGQRQQASISAFADVMKQAGENALIRQREENRITMAVCGACGAFAALLLL